MFSAVRLKLEPLPTSDWICKIASSIRARNGIRFVCFDVDKSPYWLPFGVPISFKFDGFTTGRFVASLVAGSTATRVGLLVTVTATAHGIPSGTYDGSYFFFPGCPSLAAGWYSGFLVVSANAVQFYLPPFWPGVIFWRVGQWRRRVFTDASGLPDVASQ